MNRPIRQFAAANFVDDSGRAQKRRKPKPAYRLITSKLEGRDAVAQAAYFSAFALAGVPLIIRIAVTKPLPEPRTAMLLSILGLVSYHLPVALPSNVKLHPGFPLVMSALYSHGCGAATLVMAPAMLLHFFTKRHGLLNCLFNASQFTICVCVAEALGLQLGWQPGVHAAAGDVPMVCLLMMTSSVLNILFVSISRSIENKEPWKNCFARLLYTERKAILQQRTFLTVVAMLLSSHMGNTALIIVFLGILSLRRETVFQRELVEKTEEAETDALTGVYNMRYLEKWLNTEFGTGAEDKGSCCFMFLDIDGLKAVNDRYGHDVGDRLLIYVAEILLANVRGKDKVVRYGGDEFVIALPGTGLQQAATVAMRILRVPDSAPFLVNGAKGDFGLSIGVASWPEHGETAMDAIRMADRAMYVAKKSGGSTVYSAADL